MAYGQGDELPQTRNGRRLERTGHRRHRDPHRKERIRQTNRIHKEQALLNKEAGFQ